MDAPAAKRSRGAAATTVASADSEVFGERKDASATDKSGRDEGSSATTAASSTAASRDAAPPKRARLFPPGGLNQMHRQAMLSAHDGSGEAQMMAEECRLLPLPARHCFGRSRSEHTSFSLLAGLHVTQVLKFVLLCALCDLCPLAASTLPLPGSLAISLVCRRFRNHSCRHYRNSCILVRHRPSASHSRCHCCWIRVGRVHWGQSFKHTRATHNTYLLLGVRILTCLACHLSVLYVFPPPVPSFSASCAC
jgi:hypothetical protein